ncbi:MAG: hypothetical protein NC342_05860 [Pseudoflavonifractor sp.]|nr:hypothetical protein [Alloprevotella sp.]MCM1117042.1 hypothetical protein [Pseudoflavonifractor sp.]
MTERSHQIDSLLSLAFEIEGLLMLAQRRDDMTPAEVLNMLTDKCVALMDGVDALKPSAEETQAEEKRAEEELTNTDKEETLSEDEAIAEAVSYEEREDAEPIPTIKAITLTLNDKFRFRRTIFGGSDTRLSDALATIATIEGPEELDDYITNDLCLDLTDEEVKAFIEAIQASR